MLGRVNIKIASVKEDAFEFEISDRKKKGGRRAKSVLSSNYNGKRNRKDMKKDRYSG